MSRIIASILGWPEHAVSKSINQLEDKNGYPSHDVRHLAENIQKTRTKIDELGLDPNDTTAEELYQALLIKFRSDSQQFDAQNGLDSNNFELKATKATSLVSQNLDLPQRWVLKNNSVKNILRQHPPKKIMKQLNYRSIESLLKRENLCEVQLVSSFLESAAWQKDQAKLISRLDSSNFEPRAISLGYLSSSKWGNLGTQPIVYSDDVGYLGLIENTGSAETPLLSTVILLIDALAEFRDLNLSKEIANLSSVLSWWSDMDGLISSLGSEHISLNIKDVSLNSHYSHGFDNRIMDKSRNSFWHELLQRYDNQLAAGEDTLADLKQQVISFKTFTDHQPAFEFVENV